ncbi:MAG: D-2-hydroxyacid dehydrogenase, partial [Brevinematales bacterium]
MVLSLVPENVLPREYLDRIVTLTGEKVFLPRDIPSQVMAENIDVLIIFGWSGIDLNIYPALKWVFSISAGVEKLPFESLISRGVTVTNTRGIHGGQIAEHVIGMMLSFSRQLARARDNQSRKRWFQGLPVDELTGKKLLIIVAGSIGSEIARKAAVFDMDITGIKNNPSPAGLANFNRIHGKEKDILHDDLSLADYIVLITPLTDETYHLIGREEFSLMKKSAYFINISRGDTVEETSLIEALRTGKIAGAGLDVFHSEPLPADSPLWEMENVLITPHNSGISPYYMDRTADIFSKSLSLYREGKILPNLID